MERSYRTKLALVSAFKEVVKTVDFRKINVQQITDEAGMSRKSFYYHFQDKYDLVNWLFDTEFADVMEKQGGCGWAAIEMLCHYLYSNAQYYRKVLHIDGQNSLSDHIGEYIREQISTDLTNSKSILIADAIVAMLKRWLYDMEYLSVSAFIQILCEMPLVGKRAETMSEQTNAKNLQCRAG